MKCDVVPFGADLRAAMAELVAKTVTEKSARDGKDVVWRETADVAEALKTARDVYHLQRATMAGKPGPESDCERCAIDREVRSGG